MVSYTVSHAIFSVGFYVVSDTVSYVVYVTFDVVSDTVSCVIFDVVSDVGILNSV